MSTKPCLLLLLLACSLLSACSARPARLHGLPLNNRFHNFFPQKNDDEDEKSMNKGSSSSQVSWKVPQRKRGEKNPGFNLDYSPPKTHPPSHN